MRPRFRIQVCAFLIVTLLLDTTKFSSSSSSSNSRSSSYQGHCDDLYFLRIDWGDYRTLTTENGHKEEL